MKPMGMNVLGLFFFVCFCIRISAILNCAMWFIILCTNRRADSIVLILKWSMAWYVVIDLADAVLSEHIHTQLHLLNSSFDDTTISAPIDLLNLNIFTFSSILVVSIHQQIASAEQRTLPLAILVPFDIIWLVHIIDLDELYFVSMTLGLLSKWLFNSVKWQQASHILTCSLIKFLLVPRILRCQSNKRTSHENWNFALMRPIWRH